MLTLSDNRLPAWNTVGEEIRHLSLQDAATKAGFNFQVAQKPCMVLVDAPTISVNEQLETENVIVQDVRRVPGKHVTYRLDTGDPLGIVGDRYEVIQTEETLLVAGALMGEGWQPQFAGQRGNGTVTFMYGTLPHRIRNDDIEAGMLLINSFDGSTGFSVVNTMMRTDCTNALRLAIQNAKGRFTFRHTGEWRARLAEASDALKVATTYAETFDKEIAHLLQIKLDFAKAQDIVKKVFPLYPSSQPLTERSRTQRLTRQMQILDTLEFSSTIPDEMRNTGWGLIQAVSEFEQWRTRSIDNARRAELLMKEQESARGGAWLTKTYKLIKQMA